MTDPFAPQVQQGDNWISFQFVSEPGYGRTGLTVHGSPEFVSGLFGIEEFNGKISALMKRAPELDEYFKALYRGQAAPKA